MDDTASWRKQENLKMSSTVKAHYFFDTEFRDSGAGFTIDFISIGIVGENGDEFYGVADDIPLFDEQKNKWLIENVINKLPSAHARMSRAQIRQGILDVIAPASSVEFWAKNGSYDTFILCRLFGGMADFFETLKKEKGITKVTFRDSNELRRLYGAPRVAAQPEAEKHIAINDARQEKKEFDYYQNSFLAKPQQRPSPPSP